MPPRHNISIESIKFSSEIFKGCKKWTPKDRNGFKTTTNIGEFIITVWVCYISNSFHKYIYDLGKGATICPPTPPSISSARLLEEISYFQIRMKSPALI